MDEEKLNLPFPDYMDACWAVAGKHLPMLGDDPASITLIKSIWARRYWVAKSGRRDVEH